MNPFRFSSRRRSKTRIGFESLETRSLLTGGAGNTFAIISGTISTPGETVSVPFTVDPALMHLPKEKLALGIEVVADGSSPNLLPLITSVTNPFGTLVAQTFHSMYNPHATHLYVARLGPKAASVITPVTYRPDHPGETATYTVQVTGEGKGTGTFYLGFYLPGDAQGTGAVNKQDLNIVRSVQGLTEKANPTKYNDYFSADANRDGRIGQIDEAYTLQNQGVSISVLPDVGANLVPSSVTDPTNRSTTGDTAVFTGTATPGAAITYTDTGTSLPAFTTTADSAGNYTITVGLVAGSNTFQVKSVDGFGQTITGNIAPVTMT
jgi:hypothetical protein